MPGRLFLQINMTVDGYVEDPNGDIDWHFADDEFDTFIADTLRSIEGMVFGRVAFEKLATYWPTAEAGLRTEHQLAAARLMNTLPKYVLSQTLTGSDWANSHVLSGDVPAAIERLKAAAGRDLALLAGARAAASVLDMGLVDELRLIVNPLLQGGGTRLFEQPWPTSRLRPVDVRRFAGGATLLVYRPAAAAA